MRTKEAIKQQLPKTPTRDELQRQLAGIERATLEEEFERKEKGMTAEPEGKRIARKQPYDIEPVRGTRPGTEKEERPKVPDIKSMAPMPEDFAEEMGADNVEGYINEWKKKLPPLSQWRETEYVKKIEFTGDITVPVLLVDEIIERAKKEDEEKGPEATGLADVLGKIKKVAVIAFKNDNNFTIQIWGKGSRPIELLVKCDDGRIKTFKQ